jgi:hypothetical protein
VKNNLPYFGHDHDARNHPKHKALRAQYGWEGYGRFWALNEMISDAETCRLDIRKAINKANFAEEIDLSCEGFDDFVAFLSDPNRCGLIHLDDGIITTDRTLESLAGVQERRKRQQKAYYREKGIPSQGNVNSCVGPDTKQSILDETRLEQSNGTAPPAACPLFPVQEVKNRLAFSPALDVTLDDAAAEQLAATLQAAGCEDLDYLDWALDRVAVRAKGKPIENPAGYLLSVAGLADWVADWRRERAFRQAVKRTAGPAPPGEPAVALGPMLSEYVKSGGPGGGARRQG